MFNSVVVKLSKFFYFFLLVACFNLAASDSARLKQLSLEQGLSQAQIRSLVQDDDGYLWIGTQQGLNLFDGHRVKTISGPDNLLEIQSINALFKDSHNNIWVGSVPNRNFKIDKTTNTITEYDPPFPAGREIQDSAFFEITEDHNKNLWLATMRAIFFWDSQTDDMTFVADIEPIISNRQIIRAIYSRPNYLLIATSNGLYSLDKNTKQITAIPFVDLLEKKSKSSSIGNLDRNNIKGIYLNQENNILLATVEGLYQVSLGSLELFLQNKVKTIKIKTLEEQLNIWQVVEENHFYWLASHQGLFKLSKNGELSFVLAYSKTAFESADDNITALLKDNEGNLWLGSRNDGAFKWQQKNQQFIAFKQDKNSAQSLSDNKVWSTAEDAEGNIWVGTRNGLNRIDPKTGNVREFLINPDIKANVSESTFYDIEIQGDEIWLAASGVVRRFNSKTLTETTPDYNEQEQKVLAKTVSDLFFIEENVLAIMSNEGIHTYHTETGEINLKENTNPKGKIKSRLLNVASIDPNDKDKLQMTMIDKVVKYSKSTGVISPLHQLPPSDKPRTFASDIYTNEKHTWIGYPGFGIYIIDNASGKELKHITSLNGLPDNSPLEFNEDKKGNVWVTSNSGLIRFDKDSFHFRVYDIDDGLETNEFNGGASVLSQSGDLFLGSIKGVLQVKPEKLEPLESRQLKSHITDISLMSRQNKMAFSPYVDHRLNLTHEDYGLKLKFSALSLTNPKKLRYQYWLEGSSQTRPSVTEQSELFLPKLEPGKSVFKVAVIDYETGKTSAPVSLYLNVKPHPAFSWWAYTFYILSTLILLLSFYRQRLKRQRVLIQAHDVLQASEERLQLALSGSNSGMWDWQSANNKVFDPRFSHHDAKNNLINFDKRLDAIHTEDRGRYEESWLAFIKENKEVFEFTYRMKNNTQWAWYRDLARVTEFEKSTNQRRVTGTYTDITQSKDDHDKVALFSEAFQNTHDSIIICNDKFIVQAANQSLYRTTLLEKQEVIGQSIPYILMPDEERLLTDVFSEKIGCVASYECEALLIRKHQVPLPILVSINQFNDNDEKTRYVFALTDISQQKEAQNELRKLANYDSLTGLPNRALLMDRISHALKIAERKKLQLAIFFIDLDRFKQINDTLGHDVGDQLLISAAKIIGNNIRSNDTVARLGGDEFVVMLEDIEHVEAISRVASNILKAMTQPHKLGSQEISVSSSIGIATYPNDGDTSEALLKHADIAMYHAKNLGRNNFQLYHEKMNERAHKRLILENEIRSGIRNKEFILHYQPKLSLIDNQICGFELLARWQKPDGSLVPPFEFIPLSEELGLIIDITEQLIDQAMQTMQEWIALGIDTSFALNLSAKHLHHKELLYFVEEKLSKYQVPAAKVEFELTESTIMEDITSAVSLLNQMNQKGIAISLDDFGTGYTSFKYLKDFPIDALKIDRTFVKDIGIDKKDEAIIDSIITLANKLEIKTIAEGVETQAQADYLKQKGATLVQGYLYSKPVPVDQALKLAQQRFITI